MLIIKKGRGALGFREIHVQGINAFHTELQQSFHVMCPGFRHDITRLKYFHHDDLNYKMKELSSDNINTNDFSLGGLYTARERKSNQS